MTEADTDTIFAIATPPGTGGIGVIRLSGPAALSLGCEITGRELQPRQAHFCSFLDISGQALDSGVALYFPGPASFTGEDVVELQGHAGPVVQQLLARRVAALGARQARPGEFSERAFLNDRMDLAQAEAITDLVNSGTESAARAAQRSLEGALSARVNELQQALTVLRVFVEAALDFPDEEIDFIAESDVVERLTGLLNDTQRLMDDAHQGQILRDGITVAIIGAPNTGKSSLLNAFSGRDSAIVTEVPGTTRDVLRETLSLDGLPVHVADTAGIRESADVVEAEGIRRARQAMQEADMILLLADDSAGPNDKDLSGFGLPENIPVIRVSNKIDLSGTKPFVDKQQQAAGISALTGSGVPGLVGLVRELAGLQTGVEGVFSARTRHIDALQRTADHLVAGKAQLTDFQSAETLAEDLRLSQKALGEITGEFLPEDLLGAIFSSFCIGK